MEEAEGGNVEEEERGGVEKRKREVRHCSGVSEPERKHQFQRYVESRTLFQVSQIFLGNK